MMSTTVTPFWHRWSRPCLAAAGLVLAVLCIPGPLRAHPHVFIEQQLTIVFDELGLAGIHARWMFDEMFSAMIAADHDKNKNQSLEPEEISEIKAKAFSYISAYHYYFTVSIDGTPFMVNHITDFSADLDRGRLSYEFFIPCQAAAAATPKTLKVATYDPEYYSAIYFSDHQPFELVNQDRFETRAAIREDEETLFYYDMVHPWTLFLEFAKK